MEPEPEQTQLGHSGSPEMKIVNEFTAVRIRKIRTRNGERLEILAPRTGHRVRLDAVILEALSWQSPRVLSQLLEDDPARAAPTE